MKQLIQKSSLEFEEQYVGMISSKFQPFISKNLRLDTTYIFLRYRRFSEKKGQKSEKVDFSRVNYKGNDPNHFILLCNHTLQLFGNFQDKQPWISGFITQLYPKISHFGGENRAQNE